MTKRLSHIIISILVFLFCSLSSAGQIAMPDNVCVGTERTYSVNDPSVPSTYTWTINGVVQTTTSNKLVVTWNTVGTYLITVQEHSAAGCDGDIQSGYVYVHNGVHTDTLVTACKSFTWNR